MEAKRVLSIDQSYKRTGIAVAENGKLLLVTSLAMPGDNNPEKRRYLAKEVQQFIKTWQPDIITTERARAFHQGRSSMRAMAALQALTDAIAEAARPLKTYSIETYKWKEAVLGTPHGTKQDAVAFVEVLGWPGMDDDAADAACMALYTFTGAPDLKREAISFMEQLQLRSAARQDSHTNNG